MQGLQSRLTGVQGGPGGVGQNRFLDFFSDNSELFKTLLGAELPFINPVFRGAAGRGAWDAFDSWQRQNADKLLWQNLQGGRLPF